MLFIINDKSLNAFEFKATYELDDTIEIIDFVFSIDYTLDANLEVINKIENSIINSLKILNDEKIKDLFFYMEAKSNNVVFYNYSINIKIY